jgi:hypothetical protein
LSLIDNPDWPTAALIASAPMVRRDAGCFLVIGTTPCPAKYTLAPPVRHLFPCIPCRKLRQLPPPFALAKMCMVPYTQTLPPRTRLETSFFAF